MDQKEYIEELNASLKETEGKIISFQARHKFYSTLFNILAPIFLLINIVQFDWTMFIAQSVFLTIMGAFDYLSNKRTKDQIELWELDANFKQMTIHEMMSGEIILPNLDD